MRNEWYADKRDLIKWAILYHVAELFKVKRILQIAFYRPSKFEQIEIDSQIKDMPQDVISHFRNINNIRKMKFNGSIEVFNLVFKDRKVYMKSVIKRLAQYQKEKLIVFLDPDTGLQPIPTKAKTKPKPEHVLEKEAKEVFGRLKLGDVFVFYQHQTNRAGKEWVNPKKDQLSKAIDLEVSLVKHARGLKTKDVAFFYIQKK